MEYGAAGGTWAIASPHELATEAGSVAFDRGGNAIDAALAAATTLAVAYPHMCGVGGDLFALVQHPDIGVVAINGSGRAPAGCDPVAARAAGGGQMPEHGAHTVTVPGAVSGWATLHEQGADLRWADAFGHAVALAHGGVAMSRSLAGTLSSEFDRLRADPGIRGVFFDDVEPELTRGTIRQPRLGETLQAIADHGPAQLYGGEVGKRYTAGLRAMGVPIDATDLAAHRADLGSPLRVRYRNVDVLTHPPNSQGFVLLEILGAVQRLTIDPDPLGRDAATLARTFGAASRDRDRHLAEESRMRLHPSSLLDEGNLAAIDDEVRGDLPQRSAPPGSPRPTGDTIALVAADARGWAVSLIQSLFDGFGAGLLEPTTGIVAQNRGACFTLEANHPNVLAPGARPAHTLMPVVVQRDGRFEAVAGTMGGYAQPQINAMTLIRAFDLGLSPAEAVADPRWAVEAPSSPGAAPTIEAEPHVPAEAVADLQAAGFRVDIESERGEGIGHAHMIRSTDRGFEAGSDPRADGGSMAS
jgi:gamma-glutamyltranspeptidase